MVFICLKPSSKWGAGWAWLTGLEQTLAGGGVSFSAWIIMDKWRDLQSTEIKRSRERRKGS